MIGKFDYHVNCSLLHYIPQGEHHEGHPVIVFPAKNAEVIAGGTYDFYMKMTCEATYTIDNVVYRVAHAIDPMRTNFQDGDLFDTIMHHSTGNSGSTLGDVAGGPLAELKARMAAR